MWRLIVTDSVLGFGGSAGVLLSKSPFEGGGGSDHHQLQVLAHSRVNGLLVEFLNRAVNGSVLLDVHLVMAGQDHFYLVHEALPDSHSLAQLKSNKYAGVLAPGAVNYTVTTGELEKRPVSSADKLPNLIQKLTFPSFSVCRRSHQPRYGSTECPLWNNDAQRTRASTSLGEKVLSPDQTLSRTNGTAPGPPADFFLRSKSVDRGGEAVYPLTGSTCQSAGRKWWKQSTEGRLPPLAAHCLPTAGGRCDEHCPQVEEISQLIKVPYSSLS